MKIPKIIHYCWFSGEPLNWRARMCIASWKKYLPDYEIKQWNSVNFDMHINDFVWEAYESGKWAFVADYVRLYVLYHYGGIYMDSDVEVVRNIDYFLKTPAFMGQETSDRISAGIIGALPANPCIQVFLNYYNGKHFKNQDGSYNTVINTKIITRNLQDAYGIKLNGQFQRVGDDMAIYPVDMFSPKDIITGKVKRTRRTCTIHHFKGAWNDKEEKRRIFIARTVGRILGEGFANSLFTS